MGVRGGFPVERDAGGGIAIGGAETPPGLVQMPVDGVLGEAQFAGDLLRAQVAIDKAQTLALTVRESIKAAGRLGHGTRPLVHALILGEARF